MGLSHKTVEEICARVKKEKTRNFCERIIRHARRKREAEEFQHGMRATPKKRKPLPIRDDEPAPQELKKIDEDES